MHVVTGIWYMERCFLGKVRVCAVAPGVLIPNFSHETLSNCFWNQLPS